jgi:hypothetical protein
MLMTTNNRQETENPKIIAITEKIEVEHKKQMVIQLLDLGDWTLLAL